MLGHVGLLTTIKAFRTSCKNAFNNNKTFSVFHFNWSKRFVTSTAVGSRLKKIASDQAYSPVKAIGNPPGDVSQCPQLNNRKQQLHITVAST